MVISYVETIVVIIKAVADLEGVRAGSAPPPGRRTDAVTVLLISENGAVLWRVLDFYRSTVKHALQNTQ